MRPAFRAGSHSPAARFPLPASRAPRCGAITSVTEKCQDIGDTKRPRIRGIRQDAAAMARGVTDEATRGVRAPGSGARSVSGEAVSAVRDKPAKRLQVAQTLPGR